MQSCRHVDTSSNARKWPVRSAGNFICDILQAGIAFGTTMEAVGRSACLHFQHDLVDMQLLAFIWHC